MTKAMLFESNPDGSVNCLLCSHYCRLAPGQKGICRVRENCNGTLKTLVYGHTVSQNIDPIEKKPLHHFYPGSKAFSIGTPGCNLHCDWCQNWQISQLPLTQQLPVGKPASPQDIVAAAQRNGCRSIAYTYTEPTIFFEYSYATSQLAKAAGIANVYVSNGYMSAEMLALFHPWLDAVNIDLKAFNDATYRKYAGGRLQPVLDSLKLLRKYGIWLEVTTLVIPGVNDDPQELQKMAEFIAVELGTDTPWHVSRFYPQYKMEHIPLTPQETMHKAVEVGRKAGLKNVYLGNMDGDVDTNCSTCGKLLIRRNQYGVESQIDGNSCCPKCGKTVAGVGMEGAHLP